MDEKKLNLEDVAENAKQADAQAEAEQGVAVTDRYTHIFKEPFSIGDTQVTELTFDWGTLTGADHNFACRQAMDRGWTVVLREYTPPYLTAMAARACTLRDKEGKRVMKYADMERMRLPDMTKIQDEARRFLRQSEP